MVYVPVPRRPGGAPATGDADGIDTDEGVEGSGDLDVGSRQQRIDEIDRRIAALHGEIERLQAVRAGKQASKAAADLFFKR
jgi:uncharacterized small protein (DUF1192 family)